MNRVKTTAHPGVGRREFLVALALSAVACTRPSGAAITPRVTTVIKLGYSAIGWGTADLVAIDTISTLGFTGIALGARSLQHFRRQPSVLRELLMQKKLSLVALAGGGVSIDSPFEQRMIAEHVARAQFVHDVGGGFLQVTGEGTAASDVTAASCERLGRVLTEIGRRTAELGVTLAYQPRVATIGEKPENSERVLAASDPRYVKLLLDVAHYQQGGGDPAAALSLYRDRLAYVQLTDAQATPASANATSFRFVELGAGQVPLPAVFTALREIGYNGWAIIELETTAETGRSPADSAATSRRYLESLGLSFS